MKQLTLRSPVNPRQILMAFETRQMQGMSSPQREAALRALATLLMEAVSADEREEPHERD